MLSFKLGTLRTAKWWISSRSAVSKVSDDTLTSTVSCSNGSGALVFVRDGVPREMSRSLLNYIGPTLPE
jgi:hypothetical protein